MYLDNFNIIYDSLIYIILYIYIKKILILICIIIIKKN